MNDKTNYEGIDHYSAPAITDRFAFYVKLFLVLLSIHMLAIIICAGIGYYVAKYFY